MEAVIVIAALLAGGIASIAGFGIGSILTPTLALHFDTSLAVAAVSIPHLVATSVRLWLIRSHIDGAVLRSFGIMSAVGGLAGAAIGTLLSSRWLEIVLSVLLIFVGLSGLFGFSKRMRFEGVMAWIAGAVSGFLGGLVGNQGGLRAGAMMGLGVSRDAFVATATATGLVVDLARMPVYFFAKRQELMTLWPVILLMIGGVLAGTFLGMKILRRIPERQFSSVVSTLLIALGCWLVVKGLSAPF